MPKISIILPIYHQADQLSILVKSYLEILQKLHTTFEILLVINGGDYESYVIAKQLEKHNKNIKVIYLKNAGWGNAILEGLKQSKGKFICYTNSARTRPQDLVTILRYAQQNPNVVIKATRILHVGLFRKLGSTIYNIECRILLHTPVWDVNGTPKVIPKEIAKRIKLLSKDDIIDAELMAKCVWNNIPILEVPILFPPRYGGKSTTKILSAFKMYLGVFRIKKMLNIHILRPYFYQDNS